MSVAAERLRPPSKTLMFLEGRAISELGAFLGALPLLSLAPRGDGHPVLVLPGLVASDASTRPLRSFLKNRGYAASGWRQGRNLGLRPGVQHAMTDLVKELSDTHGRKVSLVGWSLGGLYARQLAKMMAEHVRQVITLGSPFAAGPKRPMPGASMKWRAAAAPTRRTRASVDRFRGRRQCRPPRSSAAPTGSAPGRAAWRRRRRRRRASRSRAAIAAWAIIRRRSMPWPIVWRSRKANGSRSIAAAGAAWSIRIPTGNRSGCLSTSPRSSRGEVAGEAQRSRTDEGVSPRAEYV